MSAIKKAISEIYFHIPIDVLEFAFRDHNQHYSEMPTSLDHRIMLKLIRPKVLVDCNLVGGQLTNISLQGIAPYVPDQLSLVYQIPKGRTSGRSIYSVLSVGYMPYGNVWAGELTGYGTMPFNHVSNVANAAQRVGDSHSEIPAVSSATAELIGENVVLIRDSLRLTSVYFIRCILGNDENLNNISPRSWLSFAELCVLATKAYIYKECRFKIERSYLENGQELGVMKEIVESYSDAHEMYATYLKEVWRSVAINNDPWSRNRMIKMMMNPGL